ncbi:cyclin-D-binding Myb-like transcription factor 1 [Littorina saxatilis]|uniref:Cyclin-D-binding Myb-like transcription factor 1 n=1 Tax=Littorina saxatilis TaxID=31220 RepID=A0AAN9BC98_9CAEN
MEEDGSAVVIDEAENGSGIELEALANHSECVVAEVKTEVIDPEALQLSAQQYIIVAPHETEDGTTFEPSSKFIRLEGEDGQSYLLAVTGDTSALTQAHIKTDLDDITVAADEADKAELTTASTSSSGSKRSSNPPSASDGVNQTWFTTRDDKHAYQKGGHRWKQGQWTKDEVEILQNNISRYCEEQNIGDPKEIIFEMSKDERKDFYRTIARGLSRPLFSVYRRVTRMYDQKNHMGKYSPEEINTLRELKVKHGNDWAAIGTALGRSASSVKDKCRLMKDNCNSGKWYPEEERRLAQAIYELTGYKPSESITQGLSWAAVAEQVQTRSEKQCRTKWLNYLNWKQQGGADWTRQDDLSLIEKISKMDVQNDQDIDWNELAKDWPSVRSPQWLRGKWWSLKRHVPNYQDIDFHALLASLMSMQYQNAKVKNGMRVTRMELPPGAGAGEMALHIPVSLQGVDSEDADAFQAFEVLQQWTPNNSTAFLIAQPHLTTTTATVSVTGGTSTSSLSGDHIIVQAMPMSQGDGVKVENVQVQLNPQVIIQAGDQDGVTGLDQGLTIQLSDGLHPDQDLHILAGDGTMAEESGIDDDDLATAVHIRQQEIIDQESSFEVQVVSEAGGVEMEAVVSGGDLVMGCGVVSSPPQFTQGSSNDAEIIDPLSDPILTSGETDLMGNSSDLESEKVHHQGLGVGDDLQ